MKKNTLKFCLVAVIAAVVVFAGLFLASQLASALTNGDWEYSVEDGKATVTGYKGTDEAIEIPSQIDGYTVTSIKGGVTSDVYGSSGSSGMFMNVMNVTLPDTLESIGEFAFSECGLLVEVNIPDSVTEIAYRAFGDCRGLREVTLPHSVEKIDEGAFNGCTVLSEIRIGEGLSAIGDGAFAGCTSIKTVYYAGTETEWNEKVTVGKNNSYFLNAEFVYGYHIHKTEFVETVDPTCTETGTKSHWVCSCGKMFADRFGHGIILPDEAVIPALGHDFGTYNNTETCSRCGAKNPDYIPPANFKDVDKDAYYTIPVAWAVREGVTSGTSATEFSPDEGCTRGQVVTFLWRAAGKPEPTTTNNPFKDVNSKEFYYKAVLWAVENGITSGTSKTEFSPDEVCTRGQIVTFLWRSEGKPAPKGTTNPFNDVKKGDYFYDAVLWAVENGVTAGTTKTTFSPDDTCTRGQVVTFIYRCR